MNKLSRESQFILITPALHILQVFLLAIYKRLLQTGVLSTRVGRLLFRRAYFTYKRLFEARNTTNLRDFIKPDSTVIDVGANIGYFTEQFARQIGQTGRVIAVEPEPGNFAELAAWAAKSPFRDRIVLLQCAAADVPGTLNLKVDPVHFANHQLADEGIPVQVITLDSLLAEQGNPAVSLIKIDVQGAEYKVLQGTVQTLKQQHPAIFIELDEDSLRDFQTTPRDVIDFLVGFDYTIHQLEKNGVSAALTITQAMEHLTAGSYGDFLFL